MVHDPAGRVTGFQEKPARADARSNLCNCGIYAFEPAIFDLIPPKTFVDYAKDVFPRLLADGEPFHVWRLDSYWNDVGSIHEYRRGNFDALLGRVAVTLPGRELRLGVWVGEGTEVAGDAEIVPPVLIGDGCRVAAGARLVGPLVIGDGCTIGQGAVLEGVIHWNGTATGRARRPWPAASSAAACASASTPPSTAARSIGEGCTVGAGAVVKADARLGPADRGGRRRRARTARVTSLGRLAEGVVDLFLPRRCVCCGRAGGWLCEACAPSLVPLPATVCARCGAPLARARSECRECRGRELAFATARAAYLYDGPARRLVTACKFRALRSLAGEMADLARLPFEQTVAALGGVAGVDLVTCVPVHRERDLERGFDQAALLGRRLADGAGLPFASLSRAHAPRPPAERARRRRARRQRALGIQARRQNGR